MQLRAGSWLRMVSVAVVRSPRLWIVPQMSEPGCEACRTAIKTADAQRRCGPSASADRLPGGLAAHPR